MSLEVAKGRAEHGEIRRNSRTRCLIGGISGQRLLRMSELPRLVGGLGSCIRGIRSQCRVGHGSLSIGEIGEVRGGGAVGIIRRCRGKRKGPNEERRIRRAERGLRAVAWGLG